MTYLRYTFSPGFTLITLCTFTIAFCFAVLAFFTGLIITALLIMGAWLLLISGCMLGFYIRYRQFKHFNDEPYKNEAY